MGETLKSMSTNNVKKKEGKTYGWANKERKKEER